MPSFFLEITLVRSGIVINNHIVGKVTHFKYLGYGNSYMNMIYTWKNCRRATQYVEILTEAYKGKTRRRDTELTFYKLWVTKENRKKTAECGILRGISKVKW